MSKFSAELIGHLHANQWKSGPELVKEIGATWKKAGRRKIIKAIISFIWPDLGELIQEPSSGTLYPHLYHLESQGLIESQWRDEPPEILARRGGNRHREYRLTEQGRRIRSRLPSPASVGDGVLTTA